MKEVNVTLYTENIFYILLVVAYCSYSYGYERNIALNILKPQFNKNVKIKV